MSWSNQTFHTFEQDISHIELPKLFTYPFYYEAHPLCVLAAEQVQKHLLGEKEWEHNFGIDSNDGVGKMFGVLVVKNSNGEVGFLSAFSGKMADKNVLPGFVAPVFDILTKDACYLKEFQAITALNKKLEEILSSDEYLKAKEKLSQIEAKADIDITEFQKEIKTSKAIRKEKRKIYLADENPEIHKTELKALAAESQFQNIHLRKMKYYWKEQKNLQKEALLPFETEIESIKNQRKTHSNKIQNQIFDEYQFVNQKKESKPLVDLFTDQPLISGAGECAAPKLLQHAFLNDLELVCMAEFWWGKTPKSDVRRHKQYYPACQGKCKPILKHMLSESSVEPNPMEENKGADKVIEYIYEDDYIVILNKPTELLSVPGRNIKDSVLNRLRIKFPDVEGPLLVHRLDMSTSGLMVMAKGEETHRLVQQQFIKRRVKKKYMAILEGDAIEDTEGFVELPLRVNFNERPRQMVCFDKGKHAKTRYEILEQKDREIRIAFYPESGRTHQLRVHAAHHLGLNRPIKGDDLYGKRGERLHLHAEKLTLKHPKTKEMMTFEVKCPF